MIILFKYTNRTMCGHKFLRLDTEKLEFSYGNTASTAESIHAYDLKVKVATAGSLRSIEERLISDGVKNLGRK